MKLSAIAKAVAVIAPNHSILIYGPPKSGKTKLVGTAAKIPEVKRIFWFDAENGIETLLHMGLTEEELDKVTVFRLPDTRDNPVAIETLLKSFSSRTPIKVCDMHGKVACTECSKAGNSFTEFCLSSLTHDDLVVIDSGSQLGDSALNAACLGKDPSYKPGWDEYGLQGKWLGDILSVIQQAKHTNFVVITHEITLEDDDKKDKVFPLMGSKNFSMKVAKYFGTVVYVHKKMNKHVAGSSSTYRSDVLTGSRVNATLEKFSEPDMRGILIEGGILKSTPMETKESLSSGKEVDSGNQQPASEHRAVVASSNSSRPLTLAEKLAAKKAAA